MRRAIVFLLGTGLLAHEALLLRAQSLLEQAPLNESGKITVNGRPTPYLIRRLPVSSFPQLPAAVRTELTQRGCLIPQSYEAHAPENVVRGEIERRGSVDWAVLCSANGMVSLLVFLGNAEADPAVLASVPETERLQAHGGDGSLGFDWIIGAATPEQVREAQGEMKNRPPLLEHGAVAETLIDQWTIYHYLDNGVWRLVETRN